MVYRVWLIDLRILQTLVSGIPLVLGLGTMDFRILMSVWALWAAITCHGASWLAEVVHRPSVGQDLPQFGGSSHSVYCSGLNNFQYYGPVFPKLQNRHIPQNHIANSSCLHVTVLLKYVASNSVYASGIEGMCIPTELHRQVSLSYTRTEACMLKDQTHHKIGPIYHILLINTPVWYMDHKTFKGHWVLQDGSF